MWGGARSLLEKGGRIRLEGVVWVRAEDNIFSTRIHKAM